MKTVLLALGEVRRLLASRRGLVSLLAFAAFWYAVLVWFVRPAGRLAGSSDSPGPAALLDELLGFNLLERWPAPEMAAWWVAALYALPFVAVLTGADQIASDRARGTLRYLVLRVSRLQVLLGRFLGQALLMLAMVLATGLSSVVVVALERAHAVSDALASVPAATLAIWLTLLPWVALMALVSALSSTPGQATRYAVILWVVLSIASGWLARRFPDVALVDHLLPGSSVRALYAHTGQSALAAASIGVVQALVLLTLAAVVMRRRDL